MNPLLLTRLISLLLRSITYTENYFQTRADKSVWVLSGCHAYKVVIHSNLKVERTRWFVMLNMESHPFMDRMSECDSKQQLFKWIAPAFINKIMKKPETG